MKKSSLTTMMRVTETTVSQDGQVQIHSCELVISNTVGDDHKEYDRQPIEDLLVGHHEEPVNTYGNPEYWVRSMSWLLPFGSGNSESDRQDELSLAEWVCYHDIRFRKDPAFLFVVYKRIRVRNRVPMTNVLFQTSISERGVEKTNAVSVEDFKFSLDVLQSNPKNNSTTTLIKFPV